MRILELTDTGNNGWNSFRCFLIRHTQFATQKQRKDKCFNLPPMEKRQSEPVGRNCSGVSRKRRKTTGKYSKGADDSSQHNKKTRDYQPKYYYDSSSDERKRELARKKARFSGDALGEFVSKSSHPQAKKLTRKRVSEDSGVSVADACPERRKSSKDANKCSVGTSEKTNRRQSAELAKLKENLTEKQTVKPKSRLRIRDSRPKYCDSTSDEEENGLSRKKTRIAPEGQKRFVTQKKKEIGEESAEETGQFLYCKQCQKDISQKNVDRHIQVVRLHEWYKWYV